MLPEQPLEHGMMAVRSVVQECSPETGFGVA